MLRGKNPKQYFDYLKFKAATTFQHKESSIYQALAFGLVETLIRFKNYNGPTKVLYHKLKKDLEELKKATVGNQQNNQAIETFDQVIDAVKIQALTPALGFAWLDAYGQQKIVCCSFELALKLMIIKNTPGKTELHNKIFDEQPIDELNPILDMVANNYCIAIKFIRKQNDEATFKPPSAGEFPILYIHKNNDNFCILYTQEALELEKESGDPNLIRSPNILEPKSTNANIGQQRNPEIPSGPGMPTEFRGPPGQQILPGMPSGPGMLLRPGMSPEPVPQGQPRPPGMPLGPGMQPRLPGMPPGPVPQGQPRPPSMPPGPGMQPRPPVMPPGPEMLPGPGMPPGPVPQGQPRPPGMPPGPGMQPRPPVMPPPTPGIPQGNSPYIPTNKVPIKLSINLRQNDNYPIYNLAYRPPQAFNPPQAYSIPEAYKTSQAHNSPQAFNNPQAYNRPPPPPKPKNSMETKKCNVCNQDKEKGYFELILCGEDFSCSICSFCRKTNTDRCLGCQRFYSDYEKQLFDFI